MQASTAAYKTVIAGAAMTVDHKVTWTLPATAGLSRTNLATDPSIEGTTTLWIASGNPAPVVSISTAHAFAGTHSLLVTWATGNVFLTNGVYPLTTTPGLTYTISAYVWVPSGGSPAVFLYASGVGLGGFSGVSTLNDQWQRLNVTFTANSTFHYIGITPSGTPTAGQTCYVDALLIEGGSTLGTYFDGNTTNAFWTGDPNRSTSQLNVNPYQDISLTVESLSVDRQLTTDMPDGTRLITGYPAASAQLTLSGYVDQTDASKSIAWLLNPANPASPMYRSDALGSPITIQAGVYTPGNATPELFTVFTGSVDDYTVDPQAGTVTLSCLDDRTKLAKFPVIPAGAFSDTSTALSNGVGDSGQMFTSGWTLNLLAESLGYYTSPPPRNQCAFRMTGHGGAWPELGWDATAVVYSPAFLDGSGNVVDPADSGYTTGKFSTQVPNRVLVQYEATPAAGLPDGTIAGTVGPTGNSWFFECWIQARTSATIVGGGVAVNFSLSTHTSTVVDLGAAATSLGSALRPYVTVSRGPSVVTINPSGLTIPNDGAWHYFAVAFNFTSTTAFSATWYVDGVIQTQTGTIGTAVLTADTIDQATYVAWTPTESVQVTNETGPPPSNNSFVPSAKVSFDPSLNNLTVVPDVTGQDAWSVIQQIAQAEGAIAGFDELGVFRFVNRDTIGGQGSQRTITPTYSLKTLQQGLGNSFVRNHIQLPVNAQQVQTPTSVWSLSSVYGVPGGSTRTLTVSFPNPVVNLDTKASVMPSGGGTAGLSYYRAASHADGGGIELSNLTVTISQLNSTTAAISIFNPNLGTAWMLSPSAGAYPPSSDGVPCLAVGGQFVAPVAAANDDPTATANAAVTADSQWPPVVDGGAVTSPRGEQLLALSGNTFVQDQDAAQKFTDDMLLDLYQPRPLWRNVQIVADPSLQLADLVTVADPVTTLLNGTALIVGVHLSVTASDWTQTLDLRATGMPGKWILGIPGSSEMSVTTYV